MVRKRSKSSSQTAASEATRSSSSSQSQKTVLIKYDESFSSWFEYGKDLPGRDDTLASMMAAAASGENAASAANSEPSTTKKKKQPFVPKRNNPDTVRKFRSMADEVYQNELRLFSNQARGGGKSGNNDSSSSPSSSADERWMENAMKKGTLKDRIAAMSVTVASHPIHKLYALDGLLSMVGSSASSSSSDKHSSNSTNHNQKPNSRVAQLAAEAIEDLFLNTLLPSDRKLISMGQRPLYLYDDDHQSHSNKKVNGNGSSTRTISPRILLLWRYEELIKEKYDSFIRQYIARTLEDGAEQQKIAVLQTAATLLSSVPEGESALLTLIVNKLGDPDRKVASAAGHRLRLVLQQHSTMQTIVAREVQQLAHRPHLSSKALYNCITFLNQLQLRRTTLEDQALAASLVKTYFRLFEVAVDNQKRHEKGSKKSTSKSGSSSSGPDQQSGSMKGRLLSALLMGVNRAHPYLPEKDQDMKDHVDALYRIVHTAPPSAATQALLLLFHLAVGSILEESTDDHENTTDGTTQQSEKDNLNKDKQDQQRDRYYRALYATLAKSNMVSTGKHLTMYFNVLYKAMKYDSHQNRVHAFAKRLLAGVVHGPSPTIAAVLYLLQEISKTHPSLQSSWQDIPIPELNAWVVLDDTKREPKAALVDKLLDEENQEQADKTHKESRNLIPPMWEVSALGLHFHPSVAKFANDIGEIDFDGDPLYDFGLSQFLDKFAYRNPKSREKLLKQQPKAAGAMHGRQMSRIQSRLATPLNDRSFLEETNVNEQDEFFHRFFVEQARRDEIKGITRKNSSQSGDSDDEGDDVDNSHNTTQDEEDAFNAAEDIEDVDARVKPFEEYEAKWEIDEEEEAFVDSLAMSLMESEVGVPADIDDDPEGMGDWDDMNDGHNDHDDDDEGDEEIDAEKITMGTKEIEHDDANSGDDESESSDEEPDIDEKEIVRGLDVDAGNFSSEEDEDDDDDSDGFDMALLHDSEQSGDDEEDNDENHGSTEFAAAEDYEEMIEKSFAELKRKKDSDGRELEAPSSHESKSKKKRRRS